jgi:hypothetical protein
MYFNFSRRAGLATLAASLVFAASLIPTISAAAEVIRPEYVAQLEKICKPRSQATTRAVRGTRGDIQSERFASAAAKFSKAKRIFAGTVSAIAKVPRPAADRSTLSRWFAALGRQTSYLQQSIAALNAENLPRFQRASGEFFRQGSKSNNIVISFEFNYCAFKSSRYE